MDASSRMPDRAPQVLLVGQGFLVPSPLLQRFSQWGCQCQVASTLSEARQLIARQDFDLVLSKARLPDGSAYRLISALEGRPSSFFIGIELEEGSLWVPALRGGKNCWGEPALDPFNLLRLLEQWARERNAAPASPVTVTQDAAR